MNSTLLKRLFSAVRQSSDSDVRAVCSLIVEDEKRLGHRKLARELENYLHEAAETSAPPSGHGTQHPGFALLPSSKRDRTPLLQRIDHDRLRHHMVLPTEVEKSFVRIEKEYAARSRLANFGLTARRRILLYGPPGCGKSLGAERLAWRTGLPLHKVRFDTLISSFFGETAANLGRIFESAHEEPCALFLDECDTIARSRGGQHDVGEVSRVVNMLLQLLEDYHGDGLVIAATNHYEALDPAIYRRFDEAIEMPRPGVVEIQRLLEMTLSALTVEKGADLRLFAATLDGFSFSEVERIAQNAAKKAVMEGRQTVAAADLHAAASEVHRHF